MLLQTTCPHNKLSRRNYVTDQALIINSHVAMLLKTSDPHYKLSRRYYITDFSPQNKRQWCNAVTDMGLQTKLSFALLLPTSGLQKETINKKCQNLYSGKN